jgi:hypothetical protein
MRMPRRFVFFGAVALGLFGAGLSEDASAQDIPCTEEIRTLCADVQPGGGRILQCLKANDAKLSPACTQRVSELQELVSGPLGACRDDFAAHCYHPRTSTSRQAVIQCLQANRANVSPGCQQALQGVSGKRQQPRGMTP